MTDNTPPATPADPDQTTTPATPAPMLTTAEIAAQLRVSPMTVRRWIEAGELPATRARRTLRVAQGDLDRFLGQHRVTQSRVSGPPAPPAGGRTRVAGGDQ